jgi:hypothetical protein
MGNFGSTPSSLTPQQLEEYQECTFFTKKEIIYVHRKYCDLGGADGRKLGLAKVPVHRHRLRPRQDQPHLTPLRLVGWAD